ncbi:hypothetical protein C7212DRAFT_365277 [Tuber magnatum]|uniref:Uncharacterized protein n=1 Tax=Tuber magnatum TaxID=42249 RepID=A0A317SKV5_9PEZI|nr:hypothetical protein C7212DRAFT_365277 [Tuber magnatum]
MNITRQQPPPPNPLSNSYEGISGCHVPTTTESFSTSENGKTSNLMLTASTGNGRSPRPSPSPDLLNALPDPAPTNPGPPALTCPVPGCPLVLKGRMRRGYLWRHLKRPGTHKRTGDEKAAWLHLHKIEHDRLVAAGSITPPPCAIP